MIVCGPHDDYPTEDPTGECPLRLISNGEDVGVLELQVYIIFGSVGLVYDEPLPGKLVHSPMSSPQAFARR
jgi:hypothetical protein